MEPSFVKEGRQCRRQTSQSNSYCWSYYFSYVNNRPKGKEQYNARCTLESLYVKRWCTDTTLPTEGSAALRPLSSFSARGSCWRVIAVSECASYSCGSFWDTVSSCTLGWNQEAVRLSQRGNSQIWSHSGSEGEMIPTIIITLLLRFMNWLIGSYRGPTWGNPCVPNIIQTVA